MENAGHAPVNGDATPAPPAEADELFCRIAARSGLLEPSRADEALRAVEGQAPGAVASLCLARGWLNDEQVRALQASLGSTAGASPGVSNERAREFSRLVELKRLAEDGRVDACLTIQQELSGTPYARLGELLVQRAQRRRGAAPLPPQGISNRQEAFDTYVRLKQAVQRGAVDEALRHAEALRGDPEFGRLAQVQVDRARTRRAIAEGRTPSRAEPGSVTPCPRCGTTTRGRAGCPRCDDGDREAVTKIDNNHP